LIVDDATARLGDAAALSDFLGYTNRKPEQADREDNTVGIPIAPPIHKGYGVTTDELAEAQRRFTNYARLRILGTGNREYSRGSKQAFEDMHLHRLIDELRDEIADAVNYLTFLDIQLSRWKSTLEEKL
jgi:NTP pyrophosphatase (non-canonical NTP hydrolase)